MKKTAQTILVLIITALTGCRDNAHLALMMAQADSLLPEHPDSAYEMLTSIEPEVQTCPKRQRMRYELLRAKAQNKAFVDFTTDSIMLLVADYYDHHGTPNDRLMAHYLLGCTYRDLGEAPRAIDSYHTAVECADTTDSECDYRTLSCVLSQMAGVFKTQMLFTDEIECRTQAVKFSYLNGDTATAIYERCLIASSCINLGNYVTARDMLKEAEKEYREIGHEQDWYFISQALLHLYTECIAQFDEAKKLIDDFESNSELFDEKHELPPSHIQYYSLKAHYYEYSGDLDSAEYFYRKNETPNMEAIERTLMYQGLLRVFQKRHQQDSIAKYAILYCNATDSSVIAEDKDVTAKMAASYKYNRYLKEANIQQAKAARNALLLSVSISITLFILIATIVVMRKYRQRRIEKQHELDRLMQEYAEICDTLNNQHTQMELQKKRDTTLIQVLQETLANTKNDTAKQRSRNDELNKEIEILQEQYKIDMQTYTERCTQLQSKLNILIQNGAIQSIEEKARAFTNNDTAQHITHIAFEPYAKVTEHEWENLINDAQSLYPELMHELTSHPEITMQALRVSVLLLLAIPPAGIANIMGVQQQRITNIKSAINMALFHDKSARTLLANIGMKYAIYPKSVLQQMN